MSKSTIGCETEMYQEQKLVIDDIMKKNVRAFVEKTLTSPPEEIRRADKLLENEMYDSMIRGILKAFDPEELVNVERVTFYATSANTRIVIRFGYGLSMRKHLAERLDNCAKTVTITGAWDGRKAVTDVILYNRYFVDRY